MAQINGATNSSSVSSEAPRRGFHFPWRPFSARFQVMVQFEDYQVALVTMAGSRKVAVCKARQWAAEHSNEAE